jgi:hypothetical protein
MILQNQNFVHLIKLLPDGNQRGKKLICQKNPPQYRKASDMDFKEMTPDELELLARSTCKSPDDTRQRILAIDELVHRASRADARTVMLRESLIYLKRCRGFYTNQRFENLSQPRTEIDEINKLIAAIEAEIGE